jgi:hypothetical protein
MLVVDIGAEDAGLGPNKFEVVAAGAVAEDPVGWDPPNKFEVLAAEAVDAG